MFTLEEYFKQAKPGDILLTKNPAGIGKLIKFGQSLEDDYDKGAGYGHVAIAAHMDYVGRRRLHNVSGEVYESVMTIGCNHIKKYEDKDCCLLRHKGMTPAKYFKGILEVEDNLGQIYPAHRLVFHGFDMINAWIKRVIFRSQNPLKFRYMKFMPLDWPVCSELGAQFIHSAGLRGGWEKKKKGWRGVNPDDFYDAAVVNPDLWAMVLEGKLLVY